MLPLIHLCETPQCLVKLHDCAIKAITIGGTAYDGIPEVDRVLLQEVQNVTTEGIDLHIQLDSVMIEKRVERNDIMMQRKHNMSINNVVRWSSQYSFEDMFFPLHVCT